MSNAYDIIARDFTAASKEMQGVMEKAVAKRERRELAFTERWRKQQEERQRKDQEAMQAEMAKFPESRIPGIGMPTRKFGPPPPEPWHVVTPPRRKAGMSLAEWEQLPGVSGGGFAFAPGTLPDPLPPGLHTLAQAATLLEPIREHIEVPFAAAVYKGYRLLTDPKVMEEARQQNRSLLNFALGASQEDVEEYEKWDAPFGVKAVLEIAPWELASGMPIVRGAAALGKAGAGLARRGAAGALVRAPGKVLPRAGLKVAGVPEVRGAAPLRYTAGGKVRWTPPEQAVPAAAKPAVPEVPKPPVARAIEGEAADRARNALQNAADARNALAKARIVRKGDDFFTLAEADEIEHFSGIAVPPRSTTRPDWNKVEGGLSGFIRDQERMAGSFKGGRFPGRIGRAEFLQERVSPSEGRITQLQPGERAPWPGAAEEAARIQAEAGRMPPRGPVPPVEGPPPGVPPTGPVITPPAAPAGRIMGDLSDFNEVVEIASRPDIWRKVAGTPGVRSVIRPFNPSGVAVRAEEHAIVGRAVLRDQGQQLSQVAMARLNALGAQEKVFGRLTSEGLLAEGPFKGLTVNTIRTYPQKYAKQMTAVQKQWVETAAEIERAKLAFLKADKIPVKTLPFEEGGEYAGRRVWAKMSKDGEPLDVAYVGAGPGRPGAKLAAEKHRVFKTPEEAVAEGYRYLPDDEALYLNVAGAYNRVADKRMTEWLLERVPWRDTKAPPALIEAASQAKVTYNKAQQLRAALNRAVRGERIPEATIASIKRSFPTEADDLAALIPRLQQARPETAAAVQKLTARADALIANARGTYYQKVSARAIAAEQARTATYTEARIAAPAFQGKIFTGPEAKETARIMRASMEPSFNRALGAINQVNAVARYFMLAGDVSPMTIQLLFLAGGNPVAYGKAGGGFVKALFNPQFVAKYLANPENAAIAQKYPGLILPGTTEFTEAMARGGLLRKGPFKIAGWVLGPPARAFEGSLTVAGIEMTKSLDHLGTSAAAIEDIAQFVNKFRGLTSSSRLGVSTFMRQAETTALLAPRYNRAIAGLMFDLTRGGLRGSLARKALARGVAAVAAASVAISYARGESFREIVNHLIPGHPTFITWEVGGQKVGPGTKIRSVLKLFGDTAENPENLLNISQNTFMRSPAWRFLRGNLSPAISTGLDLLTGRDYIGDPTRDGLLSLATTLGENFMPIWTQTVALEGGTLAARGIRGLAEFGGFRAYPANVLWDLAGEWKGDLEFYYNIEADSIKRAKAIKDGKKGQKDSRAQYREDNPEIDAKLFITGGVSSFKSWEGMRTAFRLIQENNIDPESIWAIEERKKKRAAAQEAGVWLETTLPDTLIRWLESPVPQSALPARETAIAQASPSISPNALKWQAVSARLDSSLLRALERVWYEGGQLTEQEETQLRPVHRDYSFGQKNFSIWLKQTLRQVQENAAMGAPPEMALV